MTLIAKIIILAALLVVGITVLAILFIHDLRKYKGGKQ